MSSHPFDLSFPLEFNPPEGIPIIVPPSIQNNPDLLAIPSAYHYYISAKGDPVPFLRSADQLENQLEDQSARVWYSLSQDTVFAIRTSYVEARSDQINRLPGRNMPPSELALSLKARQRQYSDENTQVGDDFLEFLVNQTRDVTVDRLIRDIYRFPVNPSADIFQVARLLESYVRTGYEEPLRRYLADLGITSLKNHSFDYYPLYELFFLLTRFASYPLNQDQIELAQRRNQTAWNSPERRFIDAIFHLYMYRLPEALQIIDRITQEGPEAVGLTFGTPYPDWVDWANEYLELVDRPAQSIEYVGASINQTGPKYYTWTDLELIQLMEEVDLTIPDRNQFLNRYDWVENVASLIKRYRSGAASNNQYGLRK